MGRLTRISMASIGGSQKRFLGTGFLAVLLLLAGFVPRIQAQTQFSDVTNAARINLYTESYGISACDITGNGLLDIYASNHRNQPSLWINQGDGTFTG